jgi:YhcH/YjgK/YiaL family protein
LLRGYFLKREVMIADILKNRYLYENISSRIKTSLEYITNTDFSVMESGKYELDGANLFVLVQEYDSVPREQGKWECHQKYIDIQYIAEGVEQIGVNNIGKMQVTDEYNPEKDIAFLSGDGDYITFSKGSYGIFFPEDAHQPRIAPKDVPEKVKKVVIKIKID